MIFIVIIVNFAYLILILFFFSEKISPGIYYFSFNNFIKQSLIGPWIETLIFQKLIYNLCQKNNRTSKSIVYIMISSIIFGLMHLLNNVFNAIFATYMGVIFSYSYLVFAKRNESPVLVTTIIHAANNLLVSLLCMLIYFVF